MKNYAEILMKAKSYVEADEFLDKDYYFKLYMAIRQHVKDIDFQTAIKCVLNELRGKDKILSLKDIFEIPTEEFLINIPESHTFNAIFEEIKDELPKSNLSNLIWMEAIRQSPNSFEDLKNIVENLKRKMINNKKG